MLRYLTAGESHGPGLLAIVEGLPHGVPVDLDFVNAELKRRQQGYGRGPRQQMESDAAEPVAGVRFGKTLGGPVVLRIPNKVSNSEALPPIHRPRPGHADLPGALKYGLDDARDVAERSSARETAARVAAGALANSFLALFGIRAVGYVVEIAGLAAPAPAASADAALAARATSEFHALDASRHAEWKAAIDRAKGDGDTLGGVVEVSAWGLPPGLGTHATWEEKLDGRLARALMSIQTVKAVEIGAGLESARLPGSRYHDSIGPGLARGSNRAGGVEGGMTNGQPVVVRAACKPLSTLRKPLGSVDLPTGAPADAAYERSDVAVVPAASVIAEAVVAFELAKAFLDKFGGDSLDETRARHDVYKAWLDEARGRGTPA